MHDLIELSFVSQSLEEARKISRLLVLEKLVASAQIIPWIESIYMRDNQLDTVQESKIVLKTFYKNLDQVKKLIEDNSSYEIPEIIFHKIEVGNQSYCEWIEKIVRLN